MSERRHLEDFDSPKAMFFTGLFLWSRISDNCTYRPVNVSSSHLSAYQQKPNDVFLMAAQLFWVIGVSKFGAFQSSWPSEVVTWSLEKKFERILEFN